MLRRLLIVAMAAALLVSCSTYHETRYQHPEAMPQHYSQFDLVLGWDLQVTGTDTVINGVAKNVRYAYMYDLEIWVAALDPAGKVMARSVSFVIPRELRMDESAEFSLRLPLAATPGTRLRFTYKYRGSDGGGGSALGGGGGGAGDTIWWQSFDAVVPAYQQR